MAHTERNGKRVPRDNRPVREMKLGYYCVVTDTKATEKLYLQGLRNALPPDLRRQIVIQVVNAATDHLVETCLECQAKSPQFCDLWIVFDRDRVPNFDDIIQQAESCDQPIHVGWSNPCIEIWFSAYFGRMPNDTSSVSCNSAFRKLFYDKTGHAYEKADAQIYKLLSTYGDEASAIALAENRCQHYARIDESSPSKRTGCTTLHTLISTIREKAQKA